MKRTTRWMVAVAETLVAVVAIQLLYFAVFVTAGSMPSTMWADAILVYDGDPSRIPAAMLEAREIQCPRLVISSNETGLIRRLRRQGPVPHRGSVTIVPGATTTVENARFSVPVVKGVMVGNPSTMSSGFGRKAPSRVVLMTSWYHLPRAYFLTRLYAVGSGVRWDFVSTEPVPDEWWKHWELWEEFPKFWGSLGRVCLAVLGITNWPRPAGYAKAQ